MDEQVEKKGYEPKIERTVVKPGKQNRGRTKNCILALALGIAGLAAIWILSGEGLIPTRGHEAVLIAGVACVCIAIWRGINIALGVSVSVVGTAVILILFQTQVLSPGNAPFAALTLIVVFSAMTEFLRKI